MNHLAAELALESHPLPIALLGVNGIGLESGNAGATAGRTIPWLQDVVGEDVWTTWAPTYRDVVVLDGENRKVGVYNLTAHDLGVPENYAEMKQMLVDASEGKLAPLP